MSERRIPPELLAVAVDAARRALRRLDDDEVPERLRRVAASSARRLPPPLERRLIDELDSSDWLRERAVEECAVVGGALDDPRRAASVLFLERPEGWEEQVASIGAGAADRRDRGLIQDLERRLGRALRTIERLEADVADARLASARAVETGFEGVAAERDRLAATVAELRLALSSTAARRAAAEEEVAELTGALAEADERIHDLRARVGRLVRRSSGPTPERRGILTFGRAGPVEMARTLDQLIEAYRLPQPGSASATADSPLRFPPDRRPDTKEALDWLVAQARPATVIVDGYNVAFGIPGDSTTLKRRRVMLAAARLRRLAEAPVAVVVFWDSAEADGGGLDSGVEVRYVESADDAIVARVDELAGGSVVITSDRELRERVESLGAIVFWSSALHEWLGG